MVARRAGLLGAAVAVALLVTACDPAMLDPVPGFMASTEQEVNLASVIGIRYADAELHAVVRPNDETFFVLRLLSGNESGNQALWLDSGLQVRARFPNPDAEEPESDEDFPLTGPIFATANGGVQVGRILYDPGANAISNAPTIEDAFLIYPVDQGGGIWVYRVYDSATHNEFRIGTYDSNFGASIDSATVQWGQAVDRYKVTYSSVFGGTPYVVFNAVRSENGQIVTHALMDGEIAPGSGRTDVRLYEGTHLNDAGWDIRFETLQRVPQGLFGVRHDGVRLIHLDAGTGEFRGDADLSRGLEWYGRQLRVVLDPDGEFYLVFDTEARRLYKVSSWW